jgi:hypothetical protein
MVMMALVTTLITVPIVEFIYPLSMRQSKPAEVRVIDNSDMRKDETRSSMTRLGVVVEKIEDGTI